MTKSYEAFKLTPAPYLLLAGDIGAVGRPSHHSAFKAWLARQCRNYERVFRISGNNEPKQTTVENCIKMMREWGEDKKMGGKLKVMEHDRCDFNGEGHEEQYQVSLLG